jgi:hypothetical protein
MPFLSFASAIQGLIRQYLAGKELFSIEELYTVDINPVKKIMGEVREGPQPPTVLPFP